MRLRYAATFVVSLAALGCVGQSTSAIVVDRAQMLKDLKILSADDMQGREVGTAGGLKARQYVLKRFKESGIKPFGESFEHPFSVTLNGDARKAVNIVGRIGPPGQRYIVVSAHYDHIGVRDGKVYNGADDNASGTSALFAIAEHFRKHPAKHPFVIAAFDAEEEGCLGAREFVAHPAVPKSAIALNVNIDMICRDKKNNLYEVGTYQCPFLRPYLERVAKRSKVNFLFGYDKPSDAEDWTQMSDQAEFWKVGIPFVFFSVEDFENHHEATDDFETITPDFYVHSVETIIDTLEEMDRNLEKLKPSASR